MNRNFTKRTTAPYRYDIVGSFLRPAELKQARINFSDKKIDQKTLTDIENKCIKELVEKEILLGLHAVTDGEFRRSYWHLDFMWGFAGIEHNVLEHGYLFHGEETRADSARVCGKIKFIDHPFLQHFEFLQGIVQGRAVARQTIPAPAQFFAELVRNDNEKYLDVIYPDRNDAYDDLIQAYNDFILTLYNLGCRNLQLDDCTWGMLCDKEFWANMSNGEAVEDLQKLYLTLNNKVINGLPKDLIVNTHICRGNYHSTWATSGGYAPVSKNLFAKENANAYYLEFDDERSGDFAPLSDISDDKLVVLGLLTSKNGKLEDKDKIIKRIREASSYIELDRLCLSPQCGFSSTEEGNILTEEQQWRKLELIRDIANEVWGEV